MTGELQRARPGRLGRLGPFLGEGRTLVATDVIHGSAVVAPAVRLQVGINAAITANHSVCVRDRRRWDRA